MIRPDKINVGDKIGIISTARKISSKELNTAIKKLQDWGLEVVLGENLFAQENQFSGNILQRTTDLQNMINDSSIKVVLCARGGYGTAQIIDQIDFFMMYKSPKWIVGYSDITVLHSHLNQLGFATLHASMPINFKKNTKESLISIKNSLFGLKNNIQVSAHKLNRLGKVEAEVVGGNLSILYSLLGSLSDIDTSGKILFIEDLDEYLYHIDRMMLNLKRNGKLKNLKGMIVGGMTNMHDNDTAFGKTAEEIILAYVKEYNFPICFGFPAGHLKDNRAVIFGVRSLLEINKNGVDLLQY